MVKSLIMIPMSNKAMKPLSDCRRLINMASLKLMISTSATINTFSHIYQQG